MPESKSIKKTPNYHILYSELVSMAAKKGIVVKDVPHETLKDYAAMNPAAAKVIGYDMPNNEIQINAHWNTEIKDRYHNLHHELQEMGLMEKGDSYWQAHVDSLKGETDTEVARLEMPKPVSIAWPRGQGI